MNALPPPVYDPLAASLSPADDQVLLNHWLPPQAGVVVGGSRVPIANTSVDSVSVVGPATRQAIRSIPVGAGPGGIPFVPAFP